jgi:hypothetical protein
MYSGSLRDDWPAVVLALTPDGRVMFVDDGQRASHELAGGPGSPASARCENWAS